MPDQNYNPIKRVRRNPNNASDNPTWVIHLPVPSKYDWKMSDVSAADAGRTEDALMHKMQIAQKVHIELEWQNITDHDAEAILTAFNHQYLQIEYYDYYALAFQTKIFYTGDRQVTTYSRKLGISTISFNIIER